MRSAKGVAASNLHAGAIVLARIPYTDRAENKVRPAVVIHADRRHVQLRPITSSGAMTRRRGGGIEILRNGRRCWVLDTTVVVELIDVLALEKDHLDDYGISEMDFDIAVTPPELTRHVGMEALTASGARS
jgi:mRNA-degrading endonuclease toxin of MazEF toxin-antitoxin module